MDLNKVPHSDKFPHTNNEQRAAWLLMGILICIIGLSVLLLQEKKVENEKSGNDLNSVNVPAEKAVRTPKLEVQQVVGGLEKPWDIVFAGNKVLVAENGGVISVIEEGEQKTLHSISNVNANGEGGLMGLAVDPGFSDNRFLYACYNTDNDVRVSRWRINESFTAAESQTDIVTGMPANPSGRHSGCRMDFGPDGYLWIGTGDAAMSDTPQSMQSLGGKILRVDRDGNAAEDNQSQGFDKRIFSYGHRNTQGIAFASGQSYLGVSVEHGTGADDEVNLLMPGNFGWAPLPGYGESVPMTDRAAFPDAVEAVWSSGSPTLAPSGASFVYGEQWGTYEGSLFVAMLKTKHLRVLKLSTKGELKEESELFKDLYGRLRTVRQAPDGSVYFCTDNGNGADVIMRITPK